MALVRYEELEDGEAKEKIQELTWGYEDKSRYFVDLLSLGVAKIAASHYPYPVMVRMSNFKTSEYANLIGGRAFELPEENPLLGLRGASRYISARYREGFALECQAIRRVREEIGLTNVGILIPFCRALEEADRVLEVLEQNGLRRGDKGLQIQVMAETPSSIILAEQFAERFDGFSIGSNDLTTLVLGVDRNSSASPSLFDYRNEAVKRTMGRLIDLAHRAGSRVGICGDAPSNSCDLTDFLVGAGIDSVSLNPDTVMESRKRVARFESKIPSRFSRVWQKIFSRSQDLWPRH
jgi:pyruvate,water dikinase